MMTDRIPAMLKAKALQYLARREYTRAELQTKLLAWAVAQQRKAQRSLALEGEDADFPEAGDMVTSALNQQVQAMVEDCEARGWVSDERVLESVLHQRSPRLGVRRLQRELAAKGIDEALMHEALQTLKGSELERAYGVWRRRFSALPADAAGYQKQARFLTYRGFDPDVVRKVLSGFEQAD